jgi:rhodanese-related sulfurtransferase
MNALLKKVSAVVFSFALVGAIQAAEDVPESIPGTTKISAEQLIELVEKHPDLVIIDSRKASDRDKGFIEGSKHLVDTDTTPESLAKVAPNKAAPVAFFCNGVKCGRSGKAAQVAVKAGYTKIYWFRNGWEEWTAKGFPVSK